MRLTSLVLAAAMASGAAQAAQAAAGGPADPAAPAAAPAASTAPAAQGAAPAPNTPPPGESSRLPRPSEVVRFVPSGEPATIALTAVANPDCSSAGKTVARIIAKPVHGDITFDYKKVFTTFSTNLYERCNAVEVPGMVTLYKSAADYFGEDAADLLYIYPNGNAQVIHFVIEVK